MPTPHCARTGKVQYDTYHDAARALASCRVKAKHGKKYRREQFYYRCKHCGWWHLTTWRDGKLPSKRVA